MLFPLLHGVMNISEWTHNVSSDGPNQPNHYQNPLSSKIKVKESFIGLLTIFSWMITNWGRAKNLVWQFHLTTIVSLLEISQRIGILMNSLRSFPNTHVSRKTAGNCTVLLVNIPEAEHNISECLTSMLCSFNLTKLVYH